MPTSPRGQSAGLTVPAALSGPSRVGRRDMDRGELCDRECTQCRREEIIDDFAISLVRFRVDSAKPCLQPFPNRHTGRIDVRAIIERAEQPPQLLLSSATVALYCCALFGGMLQFGDHTWRPRAPSLSRSPGTILGHFTCSF